MFAVGRNCVMGGFGVLEKIRQGNQPGLNARNVCAHGDPGQREQSCQGPSGYQLFHEHGNFLLLLLRLW